MYMESYELDMIQLYDIFNKQKMINSSSSIKEEPFHDSDPSSIHTKNTE